MWGDLGVLLSFTRVPVVFVLGPCDLLATAALHGPERGGNLNAESALSGDGSVCLVSWCPMVSLVGSAPVLFGCLGSLMLGVTSPVFLLGVGVQLA